VIGGGGARPLFLGSNVQISFKEARLLTATFHSLHAGKWEISRDNLNRKEPPMNADVLTTKVTEGIAVITLGSAKRMYFDAEMGDAR
jgi:hypothetical protein